MLQIHSDFLFFFFFPLFLHSLFSGEYKADNEMFEFQTKKYLNKKINNYRPKKNSEEEDGFIQTGLWYIFFLDASIFISPGSYMLSNSTYIFTRTLSPFIPPLFFSTLFFSSLFFSLGRSVSRHPNYYCEVTMWWCVYLFSIASTGNILNFSIVGCVWLTVSPTRLFCHTQQA